MPLVVHSDTNWRGKAMPVLTLNAKAAIINNDTLLKPAYITVNKGLIENISPQAPKPSATIVDLGHLTLFPGFTNAHCHLELTSIGPLAAHDFLPWIRELLAKKIRQTPSDKVRSVRHGVTKLMRSGVTTIIDHVSSDTPIAAFDHLPINVIAFGEVLGIKEKTALATLSALKTSQVAASVPLYTSPHAVHSVAPDILKQVMLLENPHSMHISESQAEIDFMLKNQGPFLEFFRERHPDSAGSPHPRATPLACLEIMETSLKHSLIVHGNYLTAADFAMLKKNSSICLVHCPGSHAFFGHSQNPVAEARKQAIPMALGTDSLASNQDLSLLHEIKLFLDKNAAIDWRDLLDMITINANTIVGLKNVGKISVGYQADLVGFEGTASDPLDILTNARQAGFVMSQGRVLSF